ncbi:MAG: transketolase [Candidatus Neomarinimicrobiota bacterium]|nr:transketolase [Candidatus Neomarinimicrobiota bacterium]
MHTYKELESFSDWSTTDHDQFSIAVIKGLVMDATRKANSGHPGGPMSAIDFAYILFKDYLKFDPKNPDWFNRDRFVLSGGHMSMLQYSLLCLIGWLKMTDIKNFRQLHSRTPGHPEIEIPGIECTTGPLGQGFAMGTGMALAESYLRNTLSVQSGSAKGLVDHFTYILASDGDVQEPVTLGAASLAGHLGLERIIVFYDANDAQISGNTARSDSTNYATTFDGLGWNVQEIDGHDHDAIRYAIEKAQIMPKPSIIIGRTVMAKGTATMEGNHNTHGAPLPQDEIDATKEKLGLPIKQFYMSKEVVEHFQQRFSSLMNIASSWKDHEKSLRNNEDFRILLDRTLGNKLPDLTYPEFESGAVLATRKAFGATLDSFAQDLPQLIGGSADLEPSNYTGNFAKLYGDFQKGNNNGRNIAFGVREFPMAAMMNGMALHGGVIPFGGTFLVFSDYERPALRLAAIQAIRVIHEYTHDSFFVGEDGPTHQPIEHTMALRAIPNFNVFRPADAKETVACFDLALQNEKTPSALLLTRQGVPIMDLGQERVSNGVRKGAYVVKECKGTAELIFLATGSEVSLALDVAEQMIDKRIRVLSMPCWELFEQQPEKYRSEMIPNRGCMKISMEAGITGGWEKYIGPSGFSIGINRYGASAPGKDLAHEFGFTADQVVEKIQNHMERLL